MTKRAAIEGVVANLRKLDWPADGFRVLVVADNCTDSTAALARTAGAEVLERHDPARRGKGYALDFAFHTSQALGWADAVVVVDADTEVSANLLEAFAGRIDDGAKAIQAHYGVLNPQASWRTRLAGHRHGRISPSAFARARTLAALLRDTRQRLVRYSPASAPGAVSGVLPDRGHRIRNRRGPRRLSRALCGRSAGRRDDGVG